MSGRAQLIPIAKLVGPRRWGKQVRIGFKTIAVHSDAGFNIKLHNTTVIAYRSDTEVICVNTGGWQSGITAQRINHGLAFLGLRLLIRDLPNRWRIADDHGNAWTIRGNSIKLIKIGNNWHRVLPTTIVKE